ncbi:hypothetical protein EKX87_14425 [Salmonella enterica]|uniref:Uncharacterized protein n=1 Tax=Salmonella enterica TaxID=28901 RepID=A0A5T3RJF1_SALER|nr:hypothetical protein [Salmonella enterica]
MQREYDWYALLSGTYEQAFRPGVCVSDSALRRCRCAVEKAIASGMDRDAFTRTALSILENKVKKV